MASAGFFDPFRKLWGWLSAPSTIRPVRHLRITGRADNVFRVTGSANNLYRITGRAGNHYRIILGGGANVSKSANLACDRGEAVRVEWTMDPVQDVSAWTLVWELRAAPTGAQLPYAGTVLATGTSGSGITMSSDPATDGYDALLLFSSARTNRTPGTYYWTLSRTDSGSEAVLDRGTFTINNPRVSGLT